MSGISKKLMGTTAVGGFTAIEDVFSTYLYTGNDSTQTITNGIDLAGEGGLVWIKGRSAVKNNALYDTERGVNQYLYSNSTLASTSGTNMVTAFNSDGFSIGSNALVNEGPITYASWTFRKAPRFFDVVTYTGDGTNGRTVSHNLGSDPGCIIVKKTSSADAWAVWHRLSNGGSDGNGLLVLNSTSAVNVNGKFWWGDGTNYIAPTSTEFTVAVDGQVNASGQTYVAYLFAHDPLGPSEDGSDGFIACGSYTGTGANGNSVSVGWEPQWVLVKRTDVSGYGWFLIDNMRGMPSSTGGSSFFRAELSNAESTLSTSAVAPTPTGLEINGTSAAINASGGTYIYIAIRRGPMRQPESGAEVFAIDIGSNSAPYPEFTSSFPVDFATWFSRLGAPRRVGTRLLQGYALDTSSTAAETAVTTYKFDYMDGWFSSDTANISHMFRRAPGFFDVVAGKLVTSSANSSDPHSLGVTPEMMITKERTITGSWFVWHKDLPTGGDGRKQVMMLNSTSAAFDQSTASPINPFANPPSETRFVHRVNAGSAQIAYLFATLPGVSKVGSYTGNGTSQTIDCGFTSGARFVLIKRTDSTGDWYVWDTERGIVAANDPHLSLNTTAAEVTTDDSVDPDNSGFIVNQVAATNINVSSASYIYLAIA